MLTAMEGPYKDLTTRIIVEPGERLGCMEAEQGQPFRQLPPSELGGSPCHIQAARILQ
jgi:hypothetical protein